jgi:hypothetical protein
VIIEGSHAKDSLPQEYCIVSTHYLNSETLCYTT